MSNNHQQHDDIQEKLLQKEEERRKKKMKVSGKSVFEIQKQINKKTDDYHTINERTKSKNKLLWTKN